MDKMKKNSKPFRRSEPSKPDVSYVKPRKAENTCGQSKEHGICKVSRSTTLQSSTENSSSDSIWEADSLIDSIDEIERKFGRKTRQESTPALEKGLHKRLAPIYNVGISASEKSTYENGSYTSQKKTKANTKVNVIDSTGEIDLDALEKWASTTDIQIDWPSKKDLIATEQPASPSVSQAMEGKITKTDIAVREIDDILDTLSEKRDASKSYCDRTLDAKCELATERKATASPSASFSDEVNVPTMTWSHPLPAIRLPPLKGSTVVNEDIFHRKLDDMSLLHVTRTLPKIEKPSKQQAEYTPPYIKKPCSKQPEEAHVGSFKKQASDHYIDILLPGQVPEFNSDVASQKPVPVRTIVLDYASRDNDKHEKQRNKSRGQKICKLFACCQAAEEEGGVYAVDAEQKTKTSFEDIQIAVVEESVQRSLPRRIWTRLKSFFGI